MSAARPARTAGGVADGSTATGSAPVSDDVLAAFLIDNPGWLAEHPALYRSLVPPRRVHGDSLTDHMAAMLRQERLHAQAMTRQAHVVLSAGRANAAMSARVQEAVLALIALRDPSEIVDDLPRLLGADAAVLIRMNGQDDQSRRLDAQLGSREAICREAPEDAASMYAEAAPLVRHDVLVRIAGVGVLAIASRDRIGAETTIGPLQFLGRALAAALKR